MMMNEAGSAGRLWGARFSATPDAAAIELGYSTSFDHNLWREDLAGSRAHAGELLRIGVLGQAEYDAFQAAFTTCEQLFAADRFLFTAEDEDVHGAIERWLVEQLGSLGGKLRAGRSRNDQIASDLRLWCKSASGAIIGMINDLQDALITQAEQHMDWLSPGFTHLQRGQPVLLSHHLLAYVWMLERDAGRFEDALKRIDISVLGSGALAGQTLGLDPDAYRDALGFAATIENTIDGVSSRDFALELLAAAAILATNLSRLGEEIVLWASAEFGFARVGDAFSTGSSMMPQKRNPDVAELARGKAGRVIGDLVTLLTVMKGLPLSYNRDLQEDKEPVFDAVWTLSRVLPAMTGTVASLTFNRTALEAASVGNFALATDLAEELVARGVAFRDAHEIVGRVVRIAEEKGCDLINLESSDFVNLHPALDASVAERFSPIEAITRRNAHNATAFTSVSTQALKARNAVAARRGKNNGATD